MQRFELSHLNELQSGDVKQDTFCICGRRRNVHQNLGITPEIYMLTKLV